MKNHPTQLTALMILSLLHGQVPSQTQLIESLDAKSKQEKVKAVDRARVQGWPIRGKLETGEEFSLQRLAPNGMPVYYHTENLMSAHSISTDQVWPGGESQLFMDGEGMIVGEWDGGGTMLNHQEFWGRVMQVDNTTDLSDHATHVAGTMIAAGNNEQAHGMANAAVLHANDWEYDSGEMAAQAADGLILSNHSYGTRGGWHWNSFEDDKWVWWGDTEVDPMEDYHFGFYDQQTQDWDNIAFLNPHYLIVISAGNDRNDGASGGTEHWYWNPSIQDWDLSTDPRNPDGPWDCISYHKIGKNVLTVGAVNDVNNGYGDPSDVVISSFSSVGPVDDGRIKPDIVANGVGLTSSISTATNAYDSYSGTSMAAPSVTGSLVLIQQMYKMINDTTLLAATLKALAIHSADEAGEADGPDYRFGWGLLNTAKAIDLIQRNGNGYLIDERSLENNDSIEVEIVSDGTWPLKATIVWTDLPGTPPIPGVDPQDIMLVNDLDLRVIHETGTVYFPWKLDRNSPGEPAVTGDNVVDNVEQVFIANPEPGLYTVKVTHKGSINSNQAFGLVLSYETASAITYHVGPEGNDNTGDGTTENPFFTIQKAVDTAISGDTVLVSPGTYEGAVEINMKGIILTSQFIFSGDESDIDSTRIIGVGSEPALSFLHAGNSTYVNGFTFAHIGLNNEFSLECETSYLTINNCKIIDDPSESNCGSMKILDSEVDIIETTFRNINNCDLGALIIEDSYVNLDRFAILDSDNLSGLINISSSEVSFNYVTLAGNTVSEDSFIIRLMNGSELYILNSILWNEDQTEIAFSGEGAENFTSIYYTDLNGHIGNIETNGNGTTNFGITTVLNVDPIFCSSDSGNYQLSPDSPCAVFSNENEPLGAFGIGCDFMGIDNHANNPDTFKLYPAFPNPFNPITMIRFSLQEQLDVSLYIYDITGHIVETLLDGYMQSGQHEIQWNASSHASGVYIAKLNLDDKTIVQKLILLK